MKGPKVSILIPTYNRRALLEQALESARLQTYENLEIIVSDNGSKDPLLDIKERCASDPRVRWHRNPETIGLAPNWVKLVYELATGEYAKVLADDDQIHDPEHVAKAMKLVQSDGALIIFGAAGVLVEPGGRIFDIDLKLPA